MAAEHYSWKNALSALIRVYLRLDFRPAILGDSSEAPVNIQGWEWPAMNTDEHRSESDLR